MIEFRGAKKNYKNINMDLSLTLNKGEIVLLVGKNAAGKTSSLKLLLGVNDLDYGEIEIDGERINAKSKEKIGLVLQDSFFPDDFTARQIGQVLASYDMDFVDSSLALIKADKNAQKDLDKSDILSVDIGDYSASYLVKNRQKYMDGKFILEKASLDDLVRAIYRRKDK